MRDKGDWVITYGIIGGLFSFFLVGTASGCGQRPYGVDQFTPIASLVWNVSGWLGIICPLLGLSLCLSGGRMLMQSKTQGKALSSLGVSLVIFTALLSLIMSITLSISNNFWELSAYLMQASLLIMPVVGGGIILKNLRDNREN